MKISYHAKKRILQRNKSVHSFPEAKKIAMEAFSNGQNIYSFRKYPSFYDYLIRKSNQRSNEDNPCYLLVYKGFIYVWEIATDTLLTCYPIRENFITEMQKIEEKVS